MHPTRFAPSTTFGALLVATLASIACQSSPALEELPAGTDVRIEMNDGRRVAGTLVTVDPETVVLASERGDGRILVTRTQIADLSTGADADVPVSREIIVPSGAAIEATLDTPVASDTSRVEDTVRATLTAPIVADGVTIAPRGAVLVGAVTGVRESGRVKGRAELGFHFMRLQTDAVTYDIRTEPLVWVAESTKTDDAAKIGIGAAAGAVIGGLTGGGQGAAIGSAIGAGGGSAVVLATKGDEIRIGSGARLRVVLAQPLTASAPAND